jgi:hypothetical protein
MKGRERRRVGAFRVIPAAFLKSDAEFPALGLMAPERVQVDCV